MSNTVEFNKELFAAFLSDAAQKVKTEEDPIALSEYRKIFKKNVPFSLRMYVAAYLSKMAFEGNAGHRPHREFNRDARDNRRGFNRRQNAEGESPRPSSTRVVIDEALATTLFIGIGRNRRVFPRDLITLICQVAGLERDRIGDIRVLDNYSFVQLFTEDAETVINALNGHEYRGRSLSVSYSRKREEVPTDTESRSTIQDTQEINESSNDTPFDEEDAAALAAAEAAFAAAHPDQVIGAPSLSSTEENNE